MKRILPRSACFVYLAFVASSHAAEFKFPNHAITVPDGFEVELVAAPPLVQRPIAASFDDQGRLYVTDSAGNSDKADKQLETKPHRIVRLEDPDGDGRFDRSVVYADKMMFPEGCMWLDGSLYVAAPPQIWKLTDTDGDGVADQRAVWFDGKTLTGCANDLHGPFRGPDGWIYWCKGAFAQQTYERPGKPPFVTRAAHIFRARPDGSGIEPVMTGGMDNPVGVAFNSAGERFLTATFFQQPAGGRRDGIIHAIYGGVYGKVHDVIDDHKKTGDLMPVLVHLGPAAPCGIACYKSRVFGDEFRDNLFVCSFNLHKVTRHVLVPDGATFHTEDSDFFSSDNPDFHPTDVIEDADGSLLIVDTGGWYKVCCPTSQLSKPDILGAIYRVRKKGAPKLVDPRGIKLAWPTMSPTELAALLGDPRAAVCEHAVRELGKMGTAAVPALRTVLTNSPSEDARRNAVWALTPIAGEDAGATVRAALTDRDESVRHAAAHSVSMLRDLYATAPLVTLLRDPSPQLQRVAAEALGRIGDRAMVPQLLATPARDRVTQHSLIYALLEIGDRDAIATGLQSNKLGTSLAALIALDQMDNGGLKAEDVIPLFTSNIPSLRKSATWIVGHHADWGATLVGYFRDRLSASPGEIERTEIQSQLAQFARNPAIQDLIADLVGNPKTSEASRLTALRAMTGAGLKETPARWLTELARVLSSDDPAILRQAIATVRALAMPKQIPAELSAVLLSTGRRPSLPAEIRLDALAALPTTLPSLESEVFDFLRANIVSTKPLPIRSTAASVLAKAKLSAEQLTLLLEAFPTAGPLELPKLLAAFERSPTEAVGLKLVAALKQSPGSLRVDQVKALLSKYPDTVQREGADLLDKLDSNIAAQKAHLDELAAAQKDGDIRRGQSVFQKTGCVLCHAMGYLGGKLGPDLTRIGAVRTERDLLEGIVYPSASFVRSYEPMTVATKSGEQFTGIVRKDAPDEVVLAIGPEIEQHIARSDIREMQPGTISLMPQGFDQALSRQDLADLVAFLKAAK